MKLDAFTILLLLLLLSSLVLVSSSVAATAANKPSDVNEALHNRQKFIDKESYYEHHRPFHDFKKIAGWVSRSSFFQYHPSPQGYDAPEGATHKGHLRRRTGRYTDSGETENIDLMLNLWRWDEVNNEWNHVAAALASSSQISNSEESSNFEGSDISYSGPAGRYVWSVSMPPSPPPLQTKAAAAAAASTKRSEEPAVLYEFYYHHG